VIQTSTTSSTATNLTRNS